MIINNLIPPPFPPKDIVFDIDEGDEENPQLMSELASDVYAYLKELEDSYTLKVVVVVWCCGGVVSWW